MNRLRTITFLFLLALQPAGAGEVDLGERISVTPYEAYMGPVKKVLGGLGSKPATMARVEALMKQGFAFEYRFKEPYLPRTPAQTEASRMGDCKDKSLWLCEKLGDSRVRFVIGRASMASKLSHAWVMWFNDGRWWVLDCTKNTAPVLADRVGDSTYIARYSYDKGACYKHRAAEASGAPARPTAIRP